MSQGKTRSYLLQTLSKVSGAAREWIGTPYKHQAHIKGVGADCAGVAIGVLSELGYIKMDDHRLKRLSNYGRLPNPSAMERNMRMFLRKYKGNPKPGVIAWIQWRENLPMHIGIISGNEDNLTLIHSYSDVGRVVENSLTEEWIDRIHSLWVPE